MEVIFFSEIIRILQFTQEALKSGGLRGWQPGTSVADNGLEELAASSSVLGVPSL